MRLASSPCQLTAPDPTHLLALQGLCCELPRRDKCTHAMQGLQDKYCKQGLLALASTAVGRGVHDLQPLHDLQVIQALLVMQACRSGLEALVTFTATISNNKGGVAKTATTVQLAAALARRSARVLVVDMDPQANASRRLGVSWDPEQPVATMSEVIAENRDGVGAGAVLACGWEDVPEAENIDVVPARFDLINREAEAGAVGAVRRVKKALRGWTGEYDVVLIDTRPDLGHLVQMAFAASDAVLIVTSPEYDPVEGAVRVRDFVEEHAEDLGNESLKVGGVIVTMRKATAEQSFQLEGLQETFGDLVWDLRTTRRLNDGTELQVTPAHIPAWARFAEADSAATSLSAWRDTRGLETTAIFDQLAARFSAEFLAN